MKGNFKLSRTIAAILGGSSIGLAYTAPAAEATDSAAAAMAIPEIVVTAQRRLENIQNVPITIQALTAETLQHLSISTFDDFVKYVPNVTTAGYGPGENLVFMRGLSTGAVTTAGSGSDANFPNVAVYLDDQSAQMPYRNLDVYAADLERVEFLEGPQGTLFGAGAQAGAVRYITNKPKLDVTEGNVNAGYGSTAHGDPNSNVDATLNLPLIADTLALRGVIYNDSRGGYINNVPGTFTRQSSDLGIGYANYPFVPGTSVNSAGKIVPNHCGKNGAVACQAPPGDPIGNNNEVANAINPVTYQGMRLSALWKINDQWNVLISQSYQNMNSQGVFYQEPVSTDAVPLPPLSVTTFNPSYDKDRFENTALTINGQIGALKAVYTGGYLVRNVEQQQDYTAYSRGIYADYYQCVPSTASVAAKCNSPSAYWRDTEKNTHQNHEIRISTPDDWRTRGIVGAFWEDFKVYDNTDWFYKSLPNCTATITTGCITDIQPAPGSTANVPGLRDESFFDDIQRGYKQYAFFGSADFDLIPKVLTVTAGTRYYHFDNTQTGSDVSAFGCYDGGLAPCATEGATNENALNLHSTYKGFKSRANITWHVNSDAMVYYTWSQGFRPGGFNRSSSVHLNGEFATPQGFAPDELINNELGWKTEWFDHTLQFNGAVYQEEWKDVQLEFFDPGSLGNLGFVSNGANYRVRGVETQIVWRATHGLTLEGSAAYNKSRQLNSPYLIGNVPGTPDFGLPLLAAQNPYGPPGSPLAQSPLLDANVRARYEWEFNNYKAFFQIGGQHTGDSRSSTGNVPAIAAGEIITQSFDQPAYTTYDASTGMAKDNWTLQLVGQNVTNTLGRTYISDAEAIQTQTVIRPRTITVKFGYKF